MKLSAEVDNKKTGRMKKKLRWIIPVAVIVILTCTFFAYVEQYYHADDTALAAMKSDENVEISETNYGWLFDGQSDEDALIFYPGAKVETKAYAPLCRVLAQNGIDVCLVDMPFRLAMFGYNKADEVLDSLQYEHWYIAGHSLGGAFAAYYAAGHEMNFEGIILLASYSTKELDGLSTLLIYGSEDQVLTMDAYEKNKSNLPDDFVEYIIEGGNHAQFGSYGKQAGDGIALISADQQIDETVKAIREIIIERATGQPD